MTATCKLAYKFLYGCRKSLMFLNAALKAFIKPFEAPQRSVKIKI